MFELILVIILFAVSKYIHKSIINPISIFCGIWMIILMVYQLTISKTNPIGSETHLILILGIVSFFIGGFLIEGYIQYKRKLNYAVTVSRNVAKKTEIINYRLVLILCILSVFCLLPDAINSIKMLSGGGTFQMIRAQHSAGHSMLTNPLVRVLLNYVLNPFCILVVPLSAVDMFFGKKKKWLISFAVLIIIFETLISGGRTQLVYLPLHFMLMLFYSKRKIRITKKTKRIVILGVIAILLLVNYVTKLRGSEWNSDNIGLYISGGIPLMNYYISGFHSGHTLGLASLSGYLRTFFSLLENIGLVYPQFMIDMQQFLDVEKVVRIGSLEMNAYVTLFYYFYIDGGLIGVIIGSMLYGGFSMMTYLKSRKGSIKMLLIYCLIVQGLIFCMVRFQFVVIPYCLSFILAPFLFKRVYIGED